MEFVLLEEVNPNGNLVAVVEATDDVVYFYLHGSPETGCEMRAVWVRNHADAPKELDVTNMRDGQPPLNPAEHCHHPTSQPLLDEDDLSVTWLPEGNGVALYERDRPLAIIPPWSGVDGFHGYSRDAVGQGPFAWELTRENALIDRFDSAKAYWQLWDAGDPWGDLQTRVLGEIEDHFGPQSNYYAIDGGKWPPKALVRVPQDECVIYATIGVSLRPQPNVEMATEEPKKYRRIELGLVIPATWDSDAEQGIGGYLSGQSGLPWDRYTWLGDGHTLPCDSWRNPKFTAALLVHDHPAVQDFTLSPQFGDPVNLLWLLPITEDERQTAINEGSEALKGKIPNTRWKEA